MRLEVVGRRRDATLHPVRWLFAGTEEELRSFALDLLDAVDNGVAGFKLRGESRDVDVVLIKEESA